MVGGKKGEENPRVNQFYNPLLGSHFQVALFTLQPQLFLLRLHIQCLPFVKRIIALKIEVKGTNRRVVEVDEEGEGVGK